MFHTSIKRAKWRGKRRKLYGVAGTIRKSKSNWNPAPPSWFKLMQCWFKVANGLMSESSCPWGQAVGGEGCLGRHGAGPSIPYQQRCRWQVCKQEIGLVPEMPPDFCTAGGNTVTAALALQGKPVSGGNSLCPIPSPTETPNPRFFTVTFPLGLNTAAGNKFTAHGASAKVLTPHFEFYPFPFVTLALATCCCQ